MISVALSLLLASPSPGLAIGESVASFEPYWVTGPYADTRQCPICEYGALPMVLVWSQFHDPAKLKPLVQALNSSVSGSQKAFLIDSNLKAGDPKSRAVLKKLATEWDTPKVYFVSRLTSMKEVLNDYKLNPGSGWDTIVYVVKNRKVEAKFVNPAASDLKSLTEAVVASAN